MAEGAVLTVTEVGESVTVSTDATGYRCQGILVPRVHPEHAPSPLRPGDAIVVQHFIPDDGILFVQGACGCDLLLYKCELVP
jgi:hypothetical protein